MTSHGKDLHDDECDNNNSYYDIYHFHALDFDKMKNNFLQVLSPEEKDEGVWIHQDAWFSLSDLDQGKSLTYDLKKVTNGVYVFLLEGEVAINEVELDRRDGVGFWEVDKLEISASKNAKLLLMEVPMAL